MRDSHGEEPRLAAFSWARLPTDSQHQHQPCAILDVGPSATPRMCKSCVRNPGASPSISHVQGQWPTGYNLSCLSGPLQPGSHCLLGASLTIQPHAGRSLADPAQASSQPLHPLSPRPGLASIVENCPSGEAHVPGPQTFSWCKRRAPSHRASDPEKILL